MRFNWGHGIFLFLAFFVLSMAFVIYKSFQQEVLLVEKEYYPKGLEYQKQIDRVRNTGALADKIKVSLTADSVVITYPESFRNERVKGELYFYRPSDTRGDLREEIAYKPDLVQKVVASRLMTGKYILKISWTMAQREYYQEEILRIRL